MNSYETDRLILKPAEVQDADFFLELYNMPSFIQYIGDRNLRTKEDAENYITSRFIPQIEKLGFGNYVVILKEDHTKLVQSGFLKEKVSMSSISVFLFSKNMKEKATPMSLPIN